MKLFVYRLILVTLTIYAFGTESDIRWHTVNALRPDYFILPHIIMYVGLISTLASFYYLKINGEKISYYVFFVYPFLSLFDEIWHRTFGIELYTSPLMFWSPAHISFGIAILYIVYSALKLDIEKNLYLRTFMQAFFWFGIYRVAKYVLVPLSPFSIYPNLHTDYNILVPVFTYLFALSLSKFIKNKNIIIISVLFMSFISTGVYDFITGGEFIYGGPSVHLTSFLPLIFITIFEKYEINYYILYSLFVVEIIFLIQFLSKKTFNLHYFIFANLITLAFSILYFYAEEYLLKILKQKNIYYKIQSIFTE